MFGAAGARAIAQAGVTWARRIRLDLFRLSAATAGSAARVTVDSLTFLDRPLSYTRQCGGRSSVPTTAVLALIFLAS